MRAHLVVAAFLLAACASTGQSEEVARLRSELLEARADLASTERQLEYVQNLAEDRQFEIFELEDQVADLQADTAGNDGAGVGKGGGNGGGSGGGNGGGGGEPPEPPPEPQAPATIPEDGIWEVGTDFRPGTYRAPGGGLCYWARLRSANTNAIIVNGLGKNPTVELTTEGEWFETSRCGTWTRL